MDYSDLRRIRKPGTVQIISRIVVAVVIQAVGRTTFLIG